MKSIVYKTYKFPNNPETTGFKCDRTYIQHKYPGKAGNELEDFSVNAIVITGSGIFFGSDCYEEFRKLYEEFKKKGVGKVSHPVYTAVKRGLMVSLNSTIDAEKNVIHYDFEIIADTKYNVKQNKGKYVVKKKSTKKNKEKTTKTYAVGDVVQFNGGKHYVSSYSGAKGYNARAGKAKITLGPSCKGNGGAHPWHLIHTDSTSNVYGWVDSGTFS